VNHGLNGLLFTTALQNTTNKWATVRSATFGNKAIMETFEYVVLEENKTTGFTRVIGTFDSLEEAEPFWKAIAFKYIDEYELWHRIKKVKKS